MLRMRRTPHTHRGTDGSRSDLRRLPVPRQTPTRKLAVGIADAAGSGPTLQHTHACSAAYAQAHPLHTHSNRTMVERHEAQGPKVETTQIVFMSNPPVCRHLRGCPWSHPDRYGRRGRIDVWQACTVPDVAVTRSVDPRSNRRLLTGQRKPMESQFIEHVGVPRLAKIALRRGECAALLSPEQASWSSSPQLPPDELRLDRLYLLSACLACLVVLAYGRPHFAWSNAVRIDTRERWKTEDLFIGVPFWGQACAPSLPFDLEIHDQVSVIVTGRGLPLWLRSFISGTNAESIRITACQPDW